MLSNLFSQETLQKTWEVVSSQFLLALWETVYVTLLATFFAIVIGLPLGVLLVTGQKGGIRPLPKWLLRTLDVVVNHGRNHQRNRTQDPDAASRSARQRKNPESRKEEAGY